MSNSHIIRLVILGFKIYPFSEKSLSEIDINALSKSCCLTRLKPYVIRMNALTNRVILAYPLSRKQDSQRLISKNDLHQEFLRSSTSPWVIIKFMIFSHLLHIRCWVNPMNHTKGAFALCEIYHQKTFGNNADTNNIYHKSLSWWTEPIRYIIFNYAAIKRAIGKKWHIFLAKFYWEKCF